MSRFPTLALSHTRNLPGIGELIEDGLLQHGRQIIRVGSAQVSEKLKVKQNENNHCKYIQILNQLFYDQNLKYSQMKKI
jgi:hypothetical protein